MSGAISMPGDGEVSAPCRTGCGEEAVRWHLCRLCGQLLAGECLGKRRHINERYAKRCAWATQIVYPCNTCGGWHVGKALPNREALDAARVAVVAALRRTGNGWVLTQVSEEFRYLNRNEWKVRR